VGAAGDDISMPHRTNAIVQTWKRNGMGSGSLYSHFRTISPTGAVSPPKSRDVDWTVTLQDRNLTALNDFSGISGCAHAWTKDLFDFFGPINDRIEQEDLIIPLRALLIGSISFVPIDLVDYRIRHGSVSRKRYTNARERIGKMGRYWAGKIAAVEQFKKDVQLALAVGIVRREDILWLTRKTQEFERHARLIHRLYSATTIQRLKLLLSPSTQLSAKQRLKWLAIALFPWLYGRKIWQRSG
jgi:predicted metal-dependent hydrolase